MFKSGQKTFVNISSIVPWVLEDPESTAKDFCLVVTVIIMHQPCVLVNRNDFDFVAD